MTLKTVTSAQRTLEIQSQKRIMKQKLILNLNIQMFLIHFDQF